jgi:toxin ParE1/3/4
MADFFLTHRAMRDLLEIEAYSLEAFGAARTRRYMDDLYKVFNNLAENPNLGNLRRHRSEPFLMAPAGQHFVIYQISGQGIMIITLLHARRDIEGILDRLADMPMNEMPPWDQ